MRLNRRKTRFKSHLEATSLIAALCAFCLAGCESRPAPVSTNTQLQARLDAALGISHTASRDEALAAVANDAARAGEGEIVRTAIQGISNTSTADQAAATSARELARRGAPAFATDVAKLIQHSSTRDEVLHDIAKGE